MKKTTSHFRFPNPLFGIFTTLGLAIFGQVFMTQSEKPYAFWAGLFFFITACYSLNQVLPLSRQEKKPEKALSLKLEVLCFIFILLVALGFRVFRIDEIPWGMHTDQGLTGLCALRILHEGWRPFFEVLNYQVPEPLLFYLLAGWFGLVGNSYLTFHIFFVLLSLAAFPVIYWTFRQLAGPRVALLAIFILAVMRWHVIDTRNGYPSLQTPFYMFASLSLLVYFLRTRKLWTLAGSAVFCGIGLYTYQAFKVFPFLVLLYGFYELGLHRKTFKNPRKDFLTYALIVGVIATPLLVYMVGQKSLGNRERDIFIGQLVVQQKSPWPVLKNWGETALMFNRKGDMNPRHNIPGRRMLDDGTGVLFALGLFLAFRRWKERPNFYTLTGLFVMSLPCLLSTDVAHSNRMLPVTPFVAFFSASALDFLWWNLEIPFKKRKYLLDLLVFLLLSGITFQNAHTYFVEQAQNENCSRSFGIGQTDIGRTIESLEQKQPGRHRYLISPFYYQNHTVSFLGYSAQNRIFEFHPEDVQFGLLQGNMDIVLFLEEGKEGVFDFLKNLSHQYQETRVKDSQTTILYRLDLPQQRLSWSKGLKGTHVNSLNWKDPPVAVRWDPVLNFTNKKDFPFTNYPPFSIRWEGQLLVPATGPYQLMALTTDMADIKIDGKMVFNKAKGPPPVITLTKGSHRLLIRYQKIRGDSMVFDLLWTKPGQDHLEIVPASAFGKIIQGGK